MVVIKNADGTYGKAYDEMGEYYYGCAWVKKDGQYGYINKAKEEITPLIYDKAKDFKGGFGFVSKNGKCGYLDPDGKEIVPIVNDIEDLKIPDIINYRMGLDYLYEKADENLYNLCLESNKKRKV